MGGVPSKSLEIRTAVGRRPTPIALSEAERKVLVREANSEKLPHRTVKRAKLILLASDGESNGSIASKLGVPTGFVSFWRRSFAAMGMDGLKDRQRSGRPMKFSPAQRLEIIATACDPGPAEYGLNGWTLDLLHQAVKARGIAVSRSRMHVILKRAELQPHRKRMWLHSPDPKFREKVDDIVGLYLAPPPGSTVVCVDEKPGMQALQRKYPDKPATPAKGNSCLSPLVATVAAQAAATCSSSGAIPGPEETVFVCGDSIACEQVSRTTVVTPATTIEAPSPETAEAEQINNARLGVSGWDGLTVQALASVFRDALSAQQQSSAELSPSVGENAEGDKSRQSTGMPSGRDNADKPKPPAKGRARKPCEKCRSCKCGRPGKPGKREFEYIRHGTLTLIGAFLVATGKVFAHIGPTRTGDDLERFMDYLASQLEGTIHIIWDNLNIHHGDRWIDFNKRHGERFHFHYTPIHASWVNQIEIWFGIFHRRCLKNGSFTSQDELRRQVEAFLAIWNERDKHPFKWSFAGYGTRETAATTGG